MLDDYDVAGKIPDRDKLTSLKRVKGPVLKGYCSTV